MQVNLSPTWILSTDHAASSHGQPVLVNLSTDEAFGPRDIVRLSTSEPLGSQDIVKLSSSYGYTHATEAVRHLVKTAKLDAEGLDLVAKFTGLIT
jgi:hypothetical protein